MTVAGLLGLLALSCERTAAPERLPDAGVVPRPVLTGLAAVRSTGVLRALIWQPEAGALAREGITLNDDRAQAEALARSLGLDVEFVPVHRMTDLVGALLAARGDIIATPSRSDLPIEGVSFSMPVRHVKEVVVVSRKAKRVPRGPWALRRFRMLRAANTSRDVISRLEKERKLDVVDVPDTTDIYGILYRIGTGKDEATITLSHHLDDYLTYRSDVRAAFTVGRVPLSLAVREEIAELWDVANTFLTEYGLTPHRRRRFGGDLDEIRKRGVIRVALLNNSVSYFIYRGQEVGFLFDLAELLSRRLGVRLELVVPERPDDLLRMLVENRADLAVVGPTLDNPYFDRCAYSLPIDHADQVLVQPVGEKPVTHVSELVGKSIHVRRSSQYFETLKQVARAVPGLRIVAADEETETEELIAQVGRGEIPLTVANSALLGVEMTYRDDVQGSLVFSRAKPLVFSVRKGSPMLLDRLNRFVLEDCSGPRYQVMFNRYFSQNRRMVEVRTESLSASGAISPFDDLAKKYGKEFGIDWRLLLAQMYQESRFDPRAKSWAGARGLMQVMPMTGAQLGLKDPWDPEQNIRAGAEYLAGLIDRIDPTLPMRQRIRFALASYNAGLGHVRDARLLARARRYDPDIWFGHVERAIQLLEKPRFHHRARHGYCRGSEPARYVGRIQDKYDAYSRLVPAVEKD